MSKSENTAILHRIWSDAALRLYMGRNEYLRMLLRKRAIDMIRAQPFFGTTTKEADTGVVIGVDYAIDLRRSNHERPAQR